LSAVSRRARPAYFRIGVEGRLAALARTPDDADQRISPDARRPEGASVSRGRNGEVLLWRRIGEAAGLHAEVITRRRASAGPPRCAARPPYAGTRRRSSRSIRASRRPCRPLRPAPTPAPARQALPCAG